MGERKSGMGGEADVEIPAPASTTMLRVVGEARREATPERVGPCGDGKKRFSVVEGEEDGLAELDDDLDSFVSDIVDSATMEGCKVSSWW